MTRISVRRIKQAPSKRVSVYTLAVNMGTSVDMIEKHYGHVKPLQAHKELTARYKI